MNGCVPGLALIERLSATWKSAVRESPKESLPRYGFDSPSGAAISPVTRLKF